MAAKKTKKLSGQTTTSTVASGEKFAKVDANGKVTLISLADLKAAVMGEVSSRQVMEGVYIMYHHKASGSALMATPTEWPGRQNSGEIADGVAVVTAGRVLVVAPTESASGGLQWCSAPLTVGTEKDREGALADLNGKANTAAALAASTSAAVTATSAYAAGFCNQYSRVNANGVGLPAGLWWLPSAGEVLLIAANLHKINYCLSLIAGATQLSGCYWTSTKGDKIGAWRIYVADLNMFNGNAVTEKQGVRPVSTYLQ